MVECEPFITLSRGLDEFSRADHLWKVYNTTFIRWTTHSPSGLSAKDTLMARFCDEQAEKFGEVREDEEKGGDVERDLVDRVAVEGAACCVPKKP